MVSNPDGGAGDAFVDEQKALAGSFYKHETQPEPDDMRTLGIELNSRGRRYKPFATAAAQLVEDTFDDWPLKDNIRAFLWLAEKMDGDGLAMVGLVESYLARKKLSDGDRAAHELRSMTKTVESVLTYDQLNAASLVSMEHLARRFLLVIGAHAENTQQPSYVGSNYYLDEGEEAIPPELRDKVTKKMKDEAKTAANVEHLRTLKSKGPRTPEPKPKP